MPGATNTLPESRKTPESPPRSTEQDPSRVPAYLLAVLANPQGTAGGDSGQRIKRAPPIVSERCSAGRSPGGGHSCTSHLLSPYQRKTNPRCRTVAGAVVSTPD
jgi:hypothetical protein